MAQLGSRLFFLTLGDDEEVTEEDLIADGERKPYMDRLTECKALVHEVLNALFGLDPKERVRSVPFQVHNLEVRSWLARFARVLAKARGSRNPSDEGDGENPHRIFAVLNNLVHGHAIVHGRKKVTMADLPVAAEVTISSMPTTFSRLFRATVGTKELTIAEAKTALGKRHHKTAEAHMKKAAETGIFELIEASGSKASFLHFGKEWSWCNSSEFKEILAHCQNLGDVCDDVTFESSITPEEERTSHAHTPQKMTTAL